MDTGKKPAQSDSEFRRTLPKWLIALLIAGGVLTPLLGTLYLGKTLPDWTATSLPLHSTFEVSGAAFGIVLALMLLFSRQHHCTSRRLLVSCALLSMGMLDIFHSCVPESQSFVWLHSCAVLAGGLFFAGTWFSKRIMARQTAVLIAAAVLGGSILLGLLSIRFSHQIPVMIFNGAFSPLATAMNLAGGWLTILGGVAFAWFYHKTRHMEDIVFLLLCFLFGTSGLLFHYSDIWHAGWWFWHVLRLAGYLLPLWLAVCAYRLAEEKTIQNQANLAMAIAQGDFSIEITLMNEQDELGRALQAMTAALRENKEQRDQQDWVKTGLARLNDKLRGDLDMDTLASLAIGEIATYINAPVGAFYSVAPDDPTVLSLAGSYAFVERKNLSDRFSVGEGLVGQAAREKQPIVLKNVPKDYIRITSQLGDCVPRFICVYPFLHEGAVRGVIEIGTLRELSSAHWDYLTKAAGILSLVVESAHKRTRLATLLNESQAFSEELQAQQEELRVANEELQESEEELKTQQEELQVTNEELEEKTQYLEQQKKILSAAAQELEAKTIELARSSQYKSEFLANMSHELRTPLNSLLILSGSLAENSEGNLTEDQVESAKIIQDSGRDLLSLINEILDLSKIEAGRMELDIENIPVKRLAQEVQRDFQHVADDKNIRLHVRLDESAPEQITSAPKRVGQILKNLLSNALKFTEKGSVTVTFSGDELRGSPGLKIEVKDTGPGIPAEKQQMIFEAFRQADGSTARKYGGTGLGLSISREMAHLLGGQIQLQSEPGKGSAFSVLFPLNLAADAEASISGSPRSSKASGIWPEPSGSSDGELPEFGSVPDDRDRVQGSDPVILVIEDDTVFAKTLLDQCHGHGFSVLIASSGEEGLYLAEKYKPDAVILDIKLPGINGWSVLDRLKSNMDTRHIPVHIMSAASTTRDALNNGAIGFLSKPAEPAELQAAFDRIEDVLSRKMKNLLVIEDDQKLRKSIVKLIGNGDVHSVDAETGEQALDMMRSHQFDCIILDLNLPDMTGFQLLEQAEIDDKISLPPVIVYTGRELTREEEAELTQYSESIIVKGVHSQERLFDEASLFLHRMVENMSEPKQKMIASLHDSDNLLKGKTILIVDDDMRNLFALSNALAAHGIKTVKAQDGRKALEALEANPDVELVLMDIMMPVMDGYETIQHIRKDMRFKKLPVIALTAKAMKEDRAKCIEAGANDYMSKPVDLDRLLSMMKVWMYR
ncbi:MAG: response regulator [Pontiellaceae bacterium]|nr:response regulator [Pontiellaceae bacterium]